MISSYTWSVRPLSRTMCLIGVGLALGACSPADSETEPLVRDVKQATDVTEPSEHRNDRVGPKPVQSDAPNIRSAESHVHGGATLSIVSENKVILMELETPLYNLLGFEYAPQTPAEKALVLEVEARLAQPQNLIRFNDEAKCTYDTLTSKTVLFGPQVDDDHDEKTDSDGHDDHDDHDEDENSADHKDVHLKYSLKCGALDKLETIQVEFFDDFPNFSELELVYLGPSQQMSADLSPSRPAADLTR